MIIGQNLWLFLLGLLTGRARLLGELAPFIPAYVMAAGLSFPDNRLAVMSGVIGGILLTRENASAGWMIAVALVTHLAMSGWPRSSNEDGPIIGPALVVGGITSAARCIKVFVDIAIPLGFYAPYGYDFIPALFDGILAFLLTLVFSDALSWFEYGGFVKSKRESRLKSSGAGSRQVWRSWPGNIVGRGQPGGTNLWSRLLPRRYSGDDRTRTSPGGRPFSPSSKTGETYSPEHVLSTSRQGPSEDAGAERGLSAVVMLGCVLAGLVGVTAGPVRIQALMISAITLAVAWIAGPTQGAACGVVLGVIGVLSTELGPQAVASLGFSGLLAGLLKKWGKVAAATGFLIGTVVLSLTFSRSWELVNALSEALLASLALIVIPGSVLRRAMSGKVVSTDVEGTIPGGLNRLRMPGTMGRFSPTLGASAETGPKGKAVQSGRAEESSLTVSFYKPGDDENKCKDIRSRGKSTFSEKRLEEVACSYDYYEASPRNAGNCQCQRVPSMERDICTKEIEPPAHAKDNCAYSTLPYQVKTDSQVPSSSLRERGPDSLILGYEVGVACHPDPSTGVVSGDYYVAREIGNHRVMLALSDGMGIGEKAMASSMATVETLETLIISGVNCAAAVKAVNSIHFFEEGDDTFTTVDLVVADVPNCKVTITKAGAPPSYLKRQDTCTIIRMESAPLGVTEDFVPEVVSIDVEQRDTLVMITDGLLERGDPVTAETWMAEVVASLEDSPGAKMAEGILRQAVARANDPIRDDMTVLVMRFTD